MVRNNVLIQQDQEAFLCISVIIAYFYCSVTWCSLGSRRTLVLLYQTIRYQIPEKAIIFTPGF
jgi:hypothetical protein